MKFERTEVWGFEHALRGMRNPLNSWDKCDSVFIDSCHNHKTPEGGCAECKFFNGFDKPCVPRIGYNDMKLCKKLIAGGSEHRKFLRQIFVSVDITAPLYWWKEFDTYKVGTVANSTSTMHKLATTPITMDCFELDDYEGGLELSIDGIYGFESCRINETLIEGLEFLRNWMLKLPYMREFLGIEDTKTYAVNSDELTDEDINNMVDVINENT